MKFGTIVCIVLFILGAVLSLVQLWFVPMDAATFTKVIVTVGVLFVVVLGVSIARHEYLNERKMKDSGYLD